MDIRPSALIVTDFPIIAAAAEAALVHTYQFSSTTWPAFVERAAEGADIIIVDVTTIDVEAALASLAPMLPTTRVVVFSLHQNEVKVYDVGQHGLRATGELPSLLALAA